jgi:hypothetical protein
MSTISENSLSMHLPNQLESQLPSNGVGNPSNEASSPNTKAPPGSASVGAQLSPLAELVSDLESLLETNPTHYAQLTGQIASNLLKAAQNAQASGDMQTANRLALLAGAFTNAAQTGQLPQFQDTHQKGNNDRSAAAADGALTTTAQLHGARNARAGSADPLAIIFNALRSAGIGT